MRDLIVEAGKGLSGVGLDSRGAGKGLSDVAFDSRSRKRLIGCGI